MGCAFRGVDCILDLEKEYLKEYMLLYEIHETIVQGKNEPPQDFAEEGARINEGKKPIG